MAIYGIYKGAVISAPPEMEFDKKIKNIELCSFETEKEALKWYDIKTSLKSDPKWSWDLADDLKEAGLPIEHSAFGIIPTIGILQVKIDDVIHVFRIKSGENSPFDDLWCDDGDHQDSWSEFLGKVKIVS